MRENMVPKSLKSTTATVLVESVHTGTAAMVDKIIKVSPETHKKLTRLGIKGETFEHIIQRLIQEHEQREQQ
jgi:hypothetical protein